MRLGNLCDAPEMPVENAGKLLCPRCALLRQALGERREAGDVHHQDCCMAALGKDILTRPAAFHNQPALVAGKIRCQSQ